MKSWKKTLIKIAVFLAVSVLLGYGMVRIDRRLRAPSDTPPQVDTVTVHDTVTVNGSDPVSVVPDGYELVPVGTSQELRRSFATIAELRDSLASVKPVLVAVHDTTYVAIPMQEYTFTDHKTYEYAVRGYGVTELWHKSFTETTTITQTVTEYSPIAFALWPKLGAYGGRDFIAAYAGIGADIAVSRDRRWVFSPEAGYGLLHANKSPVRGFYGGASIKFNLIQVK